MGNMYPKFVAPPNTPAVAPLRHALRRKIQKPQVYEGNQPLQLPVEKPVEQPQVGQGTVIQRLAEQIQRLREREAPPKLEPGARVRNPDKNLAAPGSFQTFYNQLNSIDQIGQEMTAAERARSAYGRMRALQGVMSQQVPGFQAPSLTSSGSQAAGKGASPQVAAWISQASNILGQATGKALTADEQYWISRLIQHESGGNPNAVNNWDINAKKGTPSIGLMQTIGPTFQSNRLPGYDNIRDPIANILAGVRYGIRRYGSVYNIPGIKSLRAGGKYRPY